MIWSIALLPHNNHCYHPHQYFTDHFDTSIGSKQESSSYVAIAQTIQTDPSNILFVSDNVKGTSYLFPCYLFSCTKRTNKLVSQKSKLLKKLAFRPLSLIVLEMFPWQNKTKPIDASLRPLAKSHEKPPKIQIEKIKKTKTWHFTLLFPPHHSPIHITLKQSSDGFIKQWPFWTANLCRFNGNGLWQISRGWILVSLLKRVHTDNPRKPRFETDFLLFAT